MTTVNVDITRGDLVRFTIRMVPRVRSNWITWLVVAAGIVFYVVLRNGWPTNSRQWAVLSVAAIVGASAAILVGLLLSLLTILFRSNVHNGILGRHEFTFNDQGLVEHTSANETLIKWGGVASVERTSDYIHIFVAPCIAHLIPRRSFATLEHYEEFWNHAQRLVSKSA